MRVTTTVTYKKTMISTAVGNFGRRSLWLLLLVLGQGCSPAARDWTCCQLHSQCPKFSSCRIALAPCDEFSGLEVALDSGPFPCQVSLSALHRSIPSHQGHSTTALITLVIDEVTQNYEAERLEGGQKVILSEPAKNALIKGLLDGKRVEVRTRGHRETLCQGSFPKFYSN